jgi:hypothetical protein
VPPNKPTLLTNGSSLSFGDLPRTYVLECEASGAAPLSSPLQVSRRARAARLGRWQQQRAEVSFLIQARRTSRCPALPGLGASGARPAR